MNMVEVTNVLTLMATYDLRKVSEADVAAWAAIIGNLDFEDARHAVFAHYKASRDRMMPADVIRLARSHRADRDKPAPGAMAESLDGDIPDADPDDVYAYLQAVREGRMRKYDDGTARPRPMRELASDGFGYVPGDDE